MSAMKLIDGFDYRIPGPVSHPRAEWVRMLREAIAHGGFRRAEWKETFAHGKDGLLLFEVYAIVPA